ncbi:MULTISPECIES: endonuclease V [Halolamina]|uniref:Endonuclease V n=1 Tax=Halolamina pelagica TaxID=699431 RepID=A0A1I5S0R0_9EURY|nr:endonuclease V [Halolamina sp. R1-12]SFP64247.1 Endonuclease V [Halolamina pelagica]
MEALQREIADAAAFADDLPFDPDAVAVDGPVEADASGNERLGPSSDAPVIVGVDQAFLDERAVSAIVAVQDGAVIERAHAVTQLSIPYIPGLLAFREGGPILAAIEELSVEPDLAVFDGSGRIHFRQAGIATHVGVVLDLPSVGVAKTLLCGEPAEPVDGRPAGWSTPIEAGPDVEAPEGTTIGHAYQSRQWDRSQSINPLYVSPGHRVSAATTRDLVDALCAGYKLPEPTRLADRYADEVKAEYE